MNEKKEGEEPSGGIENTPHRGWANLLKDCRPDYSDIALLAETQRRPRIGIGPDPSLLHPVLIKSNKE